MNGLHQYLDQLILKEGISPQFELTVNDKKGNEYLIPIAAVIDFLASLKKELRILVYKKFTLTENRESDVLLVFQQLAAPLVNCRI